MLNTRLIFARFSILQTVCAFALAGIFLLAAISKILHPYKFFAALQSSFQFHGRIIVVFAIVIICAEILLAIMLMVRTWQRTGALFAFCTLLIFTGFQVYLLIGNQEATCGCFIGFYERNAGPITIAENTVLLIMSLFVMGPVGTKEVFINERL